MTVLDQHFIGLFLLSSWILFSVWYTNWKGPLTPDEIEHYMARLNTGKKSAKRIQVMRAFMESDTGKPFFMNNLIDVDPNGGEESMAKYAQHVIPAMITRASHPVLVGPQVADAIAIEGIRKAESWTRVAIVRYRSRRDLMDMITQPEFEYFHGYKKDAMIKTIAVPTEPFLVMGCDLRFLLAVIFLAIPTLLNIASNFLGTTKREPTALAEIKEAASSVREAMIQANNLHGGTALDDMNLICQLVAAKEKHCNKIIVLVSHCCVMEEEDFSNDGDYVSALKAHHTLLQAAMKAKQTMAVAACTDLEAAIQDFVKLYPAK